MKIKSKAFLAAMSSALFVTASVLGTLATLHFETETVKNTFTVGEVFPESDDPEYSPFELLEHEWTDESGDGIVDTVNEENEITAFEYTAIPGATLPKDPFVRSNVEFSINAYVFVEVVDGTEGHVTYSINDNWELLEGVVGENGGDVYALNKMLEAGTKLDPTYILAGNDDHENGVVTIAADEEAGAELGTLTFYAYVTQASMFKEAKDAWDAAYGESGSGGKDEPEEEPALAGVFYDGKDKKYWIDFTSTGEVNGYYLVKDADGKEVKAVVSDNNFVPDENGYPVQAYLNNGSVALVTVENWKSAATLDGLTPTSYEAGAVYKDNKLMYKVNDNNDLVDTEGNYVYAKGEAGKLVTCEAGEDGAKTVRISGGRFQIPNIDHADYFDELDGLKMVPLFIAG